MCCTDVQSTESLKKEISFLFPCTSCVLSIVLGDFLMFTNVYYFCKMVKLTLIIELENKLFFETPCTLYLIIFPLPAPRCSLTRAWSPSIHLIRGRAHHCHEVGDLVPHVALPLLHWQIIVLECLIVGGAVRLI